MIFDKPEEDDKQEPEEEPEDEEPEAGDESEPEEDPLEKLLKQLMDKEDSGDEEEEEVEDDKVEEDDLKRSLDTVKLTLVEMRLEKFPANVREQVRKVLEGEDIDTQLKLVGKLQLLELGKEAAGKIPINKPKRESIFDNPAGHFGKERKKAYWM